MMRHLRSIMKVTWKDKVTNKVILEQADLPSMQDLLIRKTLRWTGHIIRMPSERLPKQILFSQLGERKIGRPRLRYKDTIKRNLKQREINIKTWTTLAIQRADWRSAVKWHCEDGHCRSATDSNDTRILTPEPDYILPLMYALAISVPDSTGTSSEERLRRKQFSVEFYFLKYMRTKECPHSVCKIRLCISSVTRLMSVSSGIICWTTGFF